MSLRPYYHKDNVTLYLGDCREVLPQLPDGAYDAVIVDPVWPNPLRSLAGADDPYGLFAAAAAHFPRLCKRAVVQLGCDSDPRFLLGMPREMPFFRVCWLQFAFPTAKGRVLYSGDVAYAFGTPPPAREGRMVIPGYLVSGHVDCKVPGRKKWNSKQRSRKASLDRHPCPRRLEHVSWLVKWFADGRILDPFCGLATTLVAAKMAGYPAVGVEIDERFCERAAKRLDNVPAHLFPLEAP